MLDGLLEASPNHSMEFVEGVLNDYILVYADDKNVLFFPVFASAWSNTFTIIEWVDDEDLTEEEQEYVERFWELYDEELEEDEKEGRLEQYNEYLQDYQAYEDFQEWYDTVSYNDYIIFGECLEYVEDAYRGKIYGYNQDVEYSNLLAWLESEYELSVYEITDEDVLAEIKEIYGV